MAYCDKCGHPLIMKECLGEPEPIPYCEKCGEFHFPMFNTAICTVIFNRNMTHVMMMRQYGREKYNFLAGYVNKGEDAETALRREMMEEMHMAPISSRYLYSVYFDKSNTLMLNYLTVVSEQSLSGRSITEVDDAQWFTFAEADQHVIRNNAPSQNLADRLLHYVEHEFKPL